MAYDPTKDRCLARIASWPDDSGDTTYEAAFYSYAGGAPKLRLTKTTNGRNGTYHDVLVKLSAAEWSAFIEHRSAITDQFRR